MSNTINIFLEGGTSSTSGSINIDDATEAVENRIRQSYMPCINIERSGCVPDVYTQEVATSNSTILNNILSGVGTTIFDPIYIPGRAFAINSTINIPQITAGKIIGNGLTSQYSEAHDSTFLGPASRLIWVGPTGEPMVKYKGWGWSIDGLNLIGAYRPTAQSEPDTFASIGMLIETQPTGLVAGGLTNTHLECIDCHVGVKCSYDTRQMGAGDNHFTWFGTSAVGTGYLIDNTGSSGHHFDYVKSEWGTGPLGYYTKIIKILNADGGVSIDLMILDAPCTVFEVSNCTGYFNTSFIRVDCALFNVSTGDRAFYLLKQLTDDPIALRMQGQGCNNGLNYAGSPVIHTTGSTEKKINLDIVRLATGTLASYPWC